MVRHVLTAFAMLSAMSVGAHSQSVNIDPSAVRAGTYELDPDHSRVLWTTLHRGYSYYSGLLIDLTGKMTLNPADVGRTSLAVTIPMTKGGGLHPNLDSVLQTRFFETAKFPTATFTSTQVERLADRQARVSGNLTLKGVTKPVAFVGTFNGGGIHPDSKRYIIGFNGETSIKRSDFGMTIAPVIGDEVRLSLEAEFFAVE